MPTTHQLPYEKVKRERITKVEAQTDESRGCRPDQRPMAELVDYGIVNIDKPSGPTSHQVADFVRRILDVSRTGHSGTLDPAVTGLLPVATGKATRIVQLLLPAGKEYVALMHIHADVPEDRLRSSCASFVGRISQLPPVRSAVKRQVRSRSVYYLDILEIQGRDVLFVAGTEAGTYIRKLIHDIGRHLGCGAHMTELRRTRVGPFTEKTLVTLQDLTDAWHYYHEEGNEAMLRRYIQPIEQAAEHLPKVWLLDTTVDSVCHGASLYRPGIAAFHSSIVAGDTVALLTLKEELVGYGTARCTSGEMAAPHGVAVQVEKVFMKPGTYPPAKKPEQPSPPS